MCNANAAIGLLNGTWSAQRIKQPRGIVQAQPVVDITHYLNNFTGRDYDPIFAAENSTSPNNFTAQSLQAIRCLSVDTTPGFQNWLLSAAGQAQTSALLAQIPNTDLGLMSLPQFNTNLGSSGASPASQLWNLLLSQLRRFNQPVRMGRQVTASKLLAGKRPNLVPITDSFVRTELGMSWNTSWSCYWQIMQDPRIPPLCSALRTALVANGPYPLGVNPAALSDIRILDLAVWCFHRRRL